MQDKFDVYMLCPVRKATDAEKEFLRAYKEKLENEGLRVHYAADTPQEDVTGGYRICNDHCDEIFSSRTAHVFWNPKNQVEGSIICSGSMVVHQSLLQRQLFLHFQTQLTAPSHRFLCLLIFYPISWHSKSCWPQLLLQLQ